jgi:hypothetical protein
MRIERKHDWKQVIKTIILYGRLTSIIEIPIAIPPG